MLSRDEHDRLVSGIYAAATGGAGWSAVVEQISKALGYGTGVLNVTGPDNRVLAIETFGGHDPGFAAEYYASELYANDPRTPYLLGVPLGAVYYDRMLYDVDAMYRDPGVQASCELLEVAYQLGARLRMPGGGYAAFAVLPTEADGHPSEETVLAFRRIAPHLEQALALGAMLEFASATRWALMEALACKADGVILLDRTGAPTFMNDAARAILALGDGLIHTPAGFVTHRPPETRRLAQLLCAALSDAERPATRAGGRMVVTRSSGLRPYVLTVTAAPAETRFLATQHVAAVAHIQDLAVVPLPSREGLAAFGLSERESDLAVELVRCAGLEAAATRAGMAANTARNHLQSIARKTGARGQTEIVQLLSRLI